MSTKQPEQIKHQTAGKHFVVVIDKQKYIKVLDKEAKTLIKQEIEAFNLRNSKERKKKIIKLLTPDTEKKKQEVIVAKKVLHKAKKAAVLQLKEATKELQAANVIDPILTEEEEEFFVGHKLFLVKDRNLYLKPFVNVRMPRTLVVRFTQFIKAGTLLDPLVNFWKLALLNPNSIARTKLFDYLANQNMTITPKGYIVTYRMVKKTDKTTPTGKPIYTSAHKGQEDYIMGEAYKIPRSICDEDGGRDCSRGLHTGTHRFIGIMTDSKVSYEQAKGGVGDGYGTFVTTKAETYDSYGTGYDRPSTQQFDKTFGNQAVICLVNPMHVVSVPDSNTRKMRSCELFFCGTTTPEEVINLVEQDYHIFDHSYYEYELDQINQMLEKTKLTEYVNGAKAARSLAKKKAAEEQLEEVKSKLHINQDAFNTAALTIADIHQIIASRVVKQKQLKNG